MRGCALLLLWGCSRFDRAVGMGSCGRWAHRLRLDGGLVSRAHLAFLACGDASLSDWCLRSVGIRHGAKWAAARSVTDGGLGPTLVLGGHSGAVAEVLLELVAVGVLGSVVERGASVRESALTPGLSGVLVLSRAELASGLSLLLERLLLGGVGVTDLDLKLLGGGLDGVVVEGSDDFFTSLTVLEATKDVSMDHSKHQDSNDDLPSKANTTAAALSVAKDPSRADLVRSKEISKGVLIHGLRQVGDVKVGVLFVGKGLELGVERFLDHGSVTCMLDRKARMRLTLAKLTS
jgi:hypothetical protein